MSRNARFVSAAKRLLAIQLAAALGAAAVTIWAAFEVRALVAERDSLAARVARLEAAVPPGMLPPPADAETPEAEQVDPSDDVAAPDNVSQLGTSTGGVTGNSSSGTGPSGGSGGSTVENESLANEVVVASGGSDTVGNEMVGAGGVVAEEPRRDCRRVDGRAIVCVPPFRTTPVRGVCVDGRGRPVRCPPGVVREPDAPRDPKPEQSPISRR